MYNYPFWGFPSFRRNYYSNYNYNKINYYRTNNINNSSTNSKNQNNNSYNHSNNLNKNTINESPSNEKKDSNFSNHIKEENRKIDLSCDDNYYSDNQYFNILGFNFHVDDLLILAILFCLYKEGNDDIYLYISLFLLLLS